MARFSLSCNIVAGRPSSVGHASDVVNSSSTATDSAAVDTLQATVAANVATLVADGASPTQGHVTTLNTNWGLLNTAVNTLQADIASGSASAPADVVLSFDATQVVTRTKLRAAVAALLLAAEGSNDLTP